MKLLHIASGDKWLCGIKSYTINPMMISTLIIAKKDIQPYFSQHHTLSNVVIVVVVVVVDDVVVGSSGSGCGGVVGGVVLALLSHCCAVEILLLSITMEPRLKPSHLHGD